MSITYALWMYSGLRVYLLYPDYLGLLPLAQFLYLLYSSIFSFSDIPFVLRCHAS